MLDTSESLLERISARGSEDDWDRLLKIYRPFIDVQVRRFPQLISHADDIAQDISMILLKELPEFQRQRTGSFRAWLRQIAVNQLRNALRKLKTQPILLSANHSIEDQINALSDPTSEATRRWNEEHDREVLQRVLRIVQQDVNPLHWRAFEAHVLEGKSTAQVSEELGINKNMIHLAKSRITKRLQTEASGLLD